jgi:hypothetical protein
MITAIATSLLVWVAYWQLRNLARTSRSDFLYKLKKDFFTEDARRLIFLVDNDLLEFCESEIPYFRVAHGGNSEIESRLKELEISAPSVSTCEIDDVLLGPLEDVGLLESLSQVTLREAYEVFDTYVEICAENKAIAEYLKWCMSEPDNDDVYDYFRQLYEKLKEHGPRFREDKRRARGHARSA